MYTGNIAAGRHRLSGEASKLGAGGGKKRVECGREIVRRAAFSGKSKMRVSDFGVDGGAAHRA